MATPPITAREDAGVTIVEVRGEIIVGDDGFSDEYARVVDQVLAGGGRRIVVHLDARHMTSTALGAVIESSRNVRGRGGALAAYSLRPTLRAVFKVLVHTGIFFATEDEARTCVGEAGAAPSP